MFFCLGVMAWIIRALLLAMMKSLTWLNPAQAHNGPGGPGLTRPSSSHGPNSSTNSLFSSSSSSGTGAMQQQQQLPGCARAVSPNPNRQPVALSPPRVYGTPVTYADAVSHGPHVTLLNGSGAGTAGDVAGVLKSPRNGAQGGSGSSSAGRVRFADQA